MEKELQRLVEWAQSQNPGVTFSGDHPIAAAQRVLNPPVVHHVTHAPVCTIVGQWRFKHPEGVTHSEAIRVFRGAIGVSGFVGMALHVMQQMGGQLTHRGVWVAAVRTEDCSGDPVKPKTPLLVGSIEMDFDQLD